MEAAVDLRGIDFILTIPNSALTMFYELNNVDNLCGTHCSVNKQLLGSIRHQALCYNVENKVVSQAAMPLPSQGSQSAGTFQWTNSHSSHWVERLLWAKRVLCNLHLLTHLIFVTTREWFFTWPLFYRWGNEGRQKLCPLPWGTWGLSTGSGISDAMSWSREQSLKENIFYFLFFLCPLPPLSSLWGILFSLWEENICLYQTELHARFLLSYRSGKFQWENAISIPGISILYHVI